MEETIEKYYEFDLNEFDVTKSLIKPHFDLLSRIKFNENPLASTHKHVGWRTSQFQPRRD